jgi:hypothetical protein
MRRITYRGALMAPGWPEKIVASQSQRHYTCGAVRYARIPYGTENPEWGATPCRDCGVTKGELHVFAQCEYESCPVCHASQIGSCGCAIVEFGESNQPASDLPRGRGNLVLSLVLGAIILLCIVATFFAARRFF